MPQITNLSATTELQAVNAMLSAIGEAAVASVDTARADVELAVNILKDKTRTTLDKGWKFNTEFGLALTAAEDDLAWVDPDGTAKTLSVFTPPTGLAHWELSQTAEQTRLDVTIRPSKIYEVSTAKVLVFYDRTNNRDGFEASVLKDGLLYIDAVWYFDFEQLPDIARRYITLSAARQFIMDSTGDTARAGYTAADEADALRTLRWEQGQDDEYSLLDSPDVSSLYGGRNYARMRGIDPRNNP